MVVWQAYPYIYSIKYILNILSCFYLETNKWCASVITEDGCRIARNVLQNTTWKDEPKSLLLNVNRITVLMLKLRGLYHITTSYTNTQQNDVIKGSRVHLTVRHQMSVSCSQVGCWYYSGTLQWKCSLQSSKVGEIGLQGSKKPTWLRIPPNMLGQ